MKTKLLILLSCCITGTMLAQDIKNNPTSNHGNKFEALGTILPSPNEYRTASGAPGPKYWQQRCDYDIKADLDEDKLLLSGSETITYYNNSPDELTYLWMQLDENEHSSKNNANYQDGSRMQSVVSDHHGTISVSSDEGHGAKFRIELPLRQTDRPPAASDDKPPSSKNLSSALAAASD